MHLFFFFFFLTLSSQALFSVAIQDLTLGRMAPIPLSSVRDRSIRRTEELRCSVLYQVVLYRVYGETQAPVSMVHTEHNIRDGRERKRTSEVQSTYCILYVPSLLFFFYPLSECFCGAWLRRTGVGVVMHIMDDKLSVIGGRHSPRCRFKRLELFCLFSRKAFGVKGPLIQ